MLFLITLLLEIQQCIFFILIPVWIWRLLALNSNVTIELRKFTNYLFIFLISSAFLSLLFPVTPEEIIKYKAPIWQSFLVAFICFLICNAYISRLKKRL